MKYLIVLIALFSFSLKLSAQDYERAFGIRGGLSSGFEYRVFIDDHLSYKALLSTRDRGIQIVGMKEFHEYGLFDFSDNLSLVYGFGVHVGYERWDKYHEYSSYRSWENKTAPIAGLDGLIGVEYNFLEVPLSLGFEAKPFFDMFGRTFFRIQPFDFAFTLKYKF